MGKTPKPGADAEIRREQEDEVLDREAFEEELMEADESNTGQQISHVD